MQVSSFNVSLQNRYFLGTGSIGGISLTRQGRHFGRSVRGGGAGMEFGRGG